MEPTRPAEDEHAVVELIDSILGNGIVIQADVIVSVGSVPLIGIRLEAVVAGMSKLIEYGYFEEWDRTQRHSTVDHPSRRPRPTTEGGSESEAFEGDETVTRDHS